MNKIGQKFNGIFLSTKKGFGFVRLEDSDEEVFIESRYKNTAMHGDKVCIKILKSSSLESKAEGKVINVIERKNDTLVGIVDRSKRAVFVIPDDNKINEDIFIPLGKDKKAKNKQKVVVKIEKYPTKNMSAEGKIIKILGNPGEKDTEILSLLEKYNIPYLWNDKINLELKDIPDSVKKSEIKDRVDYTDLLTITIDGEDTKDVDDAISIEKNENGYRLYVHIADVTHYVKYLSELDKEAYKRSTSVYLIDTVIPMLPQKLSNGICSLNEKVDRLALTCQMDIDKKGNVYSSDIVESIINVNYHMTYTEIQSIINKDNDIINKYSDAIDDIKTFIELSRKIDILREKNGNIDFNTQESKIKLDEKGRPIDVKPFVRQEAHRIIENFMIYANESVATEYFWKEIPFIYRVHEEPSDEKIDELKKVLTNLNINYHFGEKIYSGQFRAILESVKDTNIEAFVNEVILQSMMRARYDTVATGHFGLGLRYYSHFTSPIRRYADLQIHRIIKENIHNNINIEHYEAILNEVSKNISANQKRADDCEREYFAYQKARFMANKIGYIYKGIIDHITKFGMYIRLDNTIEGMVRISDIRFGEFIYDENKKVVREISIGYEYKIGDEVFVKVIGVSSKDRTIDFELVEDYYEIDSQQ